MIIVSEYRLSNEQINEYHEKGYRVNYSFDRPKIKPGESVGILLKNLYPSTIDLIEKMLYFKHNVSLKFEGTAYPVINTPEEWKYTTQDSKDCLQQVTYKHPIYQAYLDRRREYRQQQDAAKRLEQYHQVVDLMPKLPEEQIIKFVTTFARLYQLDVDYSDTIDVAKAYQQLVYYLDHDIPYANDVIGTPPEEEPMFSGIKFKPQPETISITEESFGDETYFEDIAFKEGEVF